MFDICKVIIEKLKSYFLIHSAGSDRYFHTCFRPYVRSHFSKYRKTLRIMIVSSGTVGLAEGLIDDTHVLYFIF